VTTNSDCKYIQLFAILDAELKWHLVRTKFFSLLICALCQTQTINFQRLAVCVDSKAKISSNLRRIQRFFAEFEIDFDVISRLIFKMLPHNPPYKLSMDRTNWKFGVFNINILMLSVVYKGVAFPLIWSLLPKAGNSGTKEREHIINRYIQLFGKDNIEHLLADREFVGDEWFEYLISRGIKFYIRIRENFEVKIPGKGRVKAFWLFNALQLNTGFNYPKIVYLKGNLVYLSGMKTIDEKGKMEFVIIASYCFSYDALSNYKERWQIETLFKALKTSGFNIEDTHLADVKRINRMLVLVAISFVWSYLVGIYRHENVEQIKIKKHGRKAHSFFAYGLALIAKALFNRDMELWGLCLKVLSCT
jgi:hypothetical protein